MIKNSTLKLKVGDKLIKAEIPEDPYKGLNGRSRVKAGTGMVFRFPSGKAVMDMRNMKIPIDMAAIKNNMVQEVKRAIPGETDIELDADMVLELKARSGVKPGDRVIKAQKGLNLDLSKIQFQNIYGRMPSGAKDYVIVEDIKNNPSKYGIRQGIMPSVQITGKSEVPEDSNAVKRIKGQASEQDLEYGGLSPISKIVRSGLDFIDPSVRPDSSLASWKAKNPDKPLTDYKEQGLERPNMDLAVLMPFRGIVSTLNPTSKLGKGIQSVASFIDPTELGLGLGRGIKKGVKELSQYRVTPIRGVASMGAPFELRKKGRNPINDYEQLNRLFTEDEFNEVSELLRGPINARRRSGDAIEYVPSNEGELTRMGVKNYSKPLDTEQVINELKLNRDKQLKEYNDVIARAEKEFGGVTNIKKSREFPYSYDPETGFITNENNFRILNNDTEDLDRKIGLLEKYLGYQEKDTFNPVIKEYGSNTEMFSDFLNQAKEQGIQVDRNSPLYKQIQDEVGGAREYYKDLSASDEQIADALYLSTKTKQAQEGLRGSQVPGMVYHGTPNKFEEFRIGGPRNYKLDNTLNHFYTTTEKDIADNYREYDGRLMTTLLDFVDRGTKPEDLKEVMRNPDLLKINDLGIADYKTVSISADDYLDFLKKYRNEEIVDVDGLPMYVHPSAVQIDDMEIGHRMPLLMSAKDVFRNTDTEQYKDFKGNWKRLDNFFDVYTKDNPKNRVLAASNKVFGLNNPSQVKSIFRNHLGKWDWNNPNIHKAIAPVGLGLGLGYGASRPVESRKAGGLIRKHSSGGLLVLGEGGEVQKVIEEGSRIFSRVHTNKLFDKARSIKELLDKGKPVDKEYEELAGLFFKFIDKQDRQEPEYV